MEFQWSRIFDMRESLKGKLPPIWKLPIISEDWGIIRQMVKDGDRVLEIGAHDRSLEKKFKEDKHQIVYESMDVDRSLPHDYYSLDKIQEKFNTIICLEVIEHLSFKEGLKMFSRIYGLLNSKGRLIISTPNVYHPLVFWMDPTHITPYNYEDLAGILISLGFRNIKVFRITSRRAAFGRSNPRRIIKRRLCRYLDIDFAKRILLTCEKA